MATKLIFHRMCVKIPLKAQYSVTTQVTASDSKTARLDVVCYFD